MSAPSQDPRIDRLNNLLPAIYRIKDAAQQFPLQALLRVIAEQVNVVEDDMTQLYNNWFIETCEDWVVPYIGDLIGYTPVSAAGLPSDDSTAEGRKLNRVLIPRREVANTIRNRRRKGTFSVLDLLANDVSGWPARAVEFYRLLGWNQNINHLHLRRARTVNVRDMEALGLLGGPFDPLAHSVNVRRIDSTLTVGRHNIPSVGVFIWRLNDYSVTHSPAYCAEEEGPNCWTFSILGQDAPLFINPSPEASPSQTPGPLNLPTPIRRLAFHQNKAAFYGQDKSLAIWVEGWTGVAAGQVVPAEDIIPADLSDWQYVPPLKKIAVDPVLGRISFPRGQLPKKGVRVTYHYGFSADIGGGEYDRPLSQSANAVIHSVGSKGQYKTINAAIAAWLQATSAPSTGAGAASPDLVVEIVDSGVYAEQLNVTLQANQSLQIRAAANKRPIIRLLDWQSDSPDAFSVTMAAGARLTLDGLLVTGRPIIINGPQTAAPEAPLVPVCGASVVIRHCTLVPGWGLDCGCEPDRPSEPSLELSNVRAQVRIQHSILGSIQIQESQLTYDPIPVAITDSILDAINPKQEALGAPGLAVANATLTMKRCTVFGIVNVHAIAMAENCIFNNCLNVARRQLGCMRFCYVLPGCRTPRRYDCQPDLVVQAVKAQNLKPAEQNAMIASEKLRVLPQFTSIRYGNPGYAQLGPNCAIEITSGADDESEMGAFHDLFQPQREANLLARLNDYTPAAMDVGIIHAT
jgi:hypothetical protein